MAETLPMPPEITGHATDVPRVLPIGSAQPSGRPPASLGFDWFMLAVAFWPLAGTFADSWAHNNVPNLETFFTPWHGLLYSGAFAVAGCTLLVMRRNHARGFPWRRAMPPGYELTVMGAFVLIASGVGDLIWHMLFGIEKNVEAIVSPTHIGLIMGITLILTGPLRSALDRPDPAALRGWAQLPLVLSTTFAYTMLSIVTQFSDPFAFRWAAYGDVDLFASPPYPPVDPFITQSLGLASLFFHTALLMGFVLFVVRRWQLFPGALTLFFGFNYLVVGAIGGAFDLLPTALAAGIIGDILLLVLRPARGAALPLRIFAFLLPVALYTAYILNLWLTHGLAWYIHLWLGAIVATGLIGWLLSYLILVPQPRGER